MNPSLSTLDCMELIRHLVVESEIDINCLNIDELVILLRKKLTNREIEEKGWTEYIPKKAKKIKERSLMKLKLKVFGLNLIKYPKQVKLRKCGLRHKPLG